MFDEQPGARAGRLQRRPVPHQAAVAGVGQRTRSTASSRASASRSPRPTSSGSWSSPTATASSIPRPGETPCAAPGLLLLLLCPGLLPRPHRRRRTGPIVLITFDSLRADVVGRAGRRARADAELRRPAAAGQTGRDGRSRRRAWASPSMASLFTGLRPWQHQVLRAADRLSPAPPHPARGAAGARATRPTASPAEPSYSKRRRLRPGASTAWRTSARGWRRPSGCERTRRRPAVRLDPHPRAGGALHPPAALRRPHRHRPARAARPGAAERAGALLRSRRPRSPRGPAAPLLDAVPLQRRLGRRAAGPAAPGPAVERRSGTARSWW